MLPKTSRLKVPFDSSVDHNFANTRYRGNIIKLSKDQSMQYLTGFFKAHGP